MTKNREDVKIDPHKRWYNLTINKTLHEFDVSSEGLSEDEAKLRLEIHGRNEIIAEEGVAWWKLLAEQFLSLLIVILIIAAIVSAFIGQVIEAVAIIVIVILAGLLGFIQEFQAGKAIESLKKMAAPNATVLRNGEEKIIPAAEIVPGDIIILQTGDKIPADARIISAKNLRVDEAALTGESFSVEKIEKEISDTRAALGDRKNMLFMGTSVTYGRGKAIVTATGMKTEFGKIATMLKDTKSRRTPLQDNLDQLGKKLGIYSIVLAVAMSLLGVLEGYPVVTMFIWGVAIAVAVIPEALPAVVTISIALGVRRMVKRKALIRKLPAVETLGATNVICTDKTGTLTQDQMTIRKIYAGGRLYDIQGSGYSPDGEIKINGNSAKISKEEALQKLFIAGVLCNDTVLSYEDGVYSIIGDPTEGSLVVAAKKAGIDYGEARKKFPRLFEIPFSSETKKMTSVHKVEGKIISFTKGAPEIVLENCSSQFINGTVVPLDEESVAKITEEGEKLSAKALRILALAYKELNGEEDYNVSSQTEMTFLGLVGMIDPPRPEAKAAIDTCFHASIRPIMITGDHKVTAIAVAKEIGIMKNGGALTGRELDELSDEAFRESVKYTDVYARISPAHKLKIVSALMEQGNIVAMTGDGVNDAPALKKADIGIAMGIKGTDVSREAADMILTNDNFASIVAAVEEGRSIFENIRKYLVYLLSGNLGTVLALIAALAFALPIPLEAVQILFINFLMDGLIAIALGVEPPEVGMMNRKPRNVKEGILHKQALIFIGVIGFWISLITLGVFDWALSKGMSEQEAMTLFFITLIFARLFNAYNCRSFKLSAFKVSFLSNKSLIVGVIISLIMTILVVNVGPLQTPFHTTAISIEYWLISFGVASTLLLVIEIMKIFLKGKN